MGLAVSTAVRFAVIYEFYSAIFWDTLPGNQRGREVGVPRRELGASADSSRIGYSAPGNIQPPRSTVRRYVALRTTTFAAIGAVSILQGGLLISLFLFSRYFILSWLSLLHSA